MPVESEETGGWGKIIFYQALERVSSVWDTSMAVTANARTIGAAQTVLRMK
jgi:hypothetical protein